MVLKIFRIILWELDCSSKIRNCTFFQVFGPYLLLTKQNLALNSYSHKGVCTIYCVILYFGLILCSVVYFVYVFFFHNFVGFRKFTPCQESKHAFIFICSNCFALTVCISISNLYYRNNA